jgi:hypothetical protein
VVGAGCKVNRNKNVSYPYRACGIVEEKAISLLLILMLEPYLPRWLYEGFRELIKVK